MPENRLLLDAGIKQLLFNNLAITPADGVLIFYDIKHTGIANEISAMLQNCHIKHTNQFVEFNSHSKLSDNDLNRLIKNDSPNVIILLLSHSIWHTRQRNEAKHQQKKRLVELVGNEQHLGQAVTFVDPLMLEDLTLYIKNNPSIRKGSVCKIKTSCGTNIQAKISNKFFIETGKYSSPGSGGDFPAGEVGFAPEKESVNGRIVYDLKVQHVGTFIYRHLTVEVKNDKIVSIDGPHADKFIEIINHFPECEYVGEIAFGINPAVQIDLDDLNHIVEEKMLGTAHFGFGAAASFGDRQGYHFDGVINNPTLFVNEEQLLLDGKICFPLKDSLVTYLKTFNQ